MKIMQLRYFVEVCRNQSVTKAAGQLHISQPSVTSAIRELEKEFGVNLFYRQKKTMILTKEGEYLYRQGEEILSQTDELERTMKNFGSKNKNVKIGVPPMIGTFVFPGLFREFREHYPDLTLEIQEYGSVQTRQQVQNDLLDAAIVILDENTEREFHCMPMMETQLVLTVARDNPLASMAYVNLDELRREPLVLMKEGSFQNMQIKKKFREAGITPNVILYSSQIYTIKQFVHYNNAGAFLFRDLVTDDPELAGIPFEPPIPIRIGLIWKRGKYIYNGTTNFIKFTKEYSFLKGRKPGNES